MAGIGFELRKILKSELLIGRIKGYAYATLVSVGPMIITVLMIIMIGQYMKLSQTPIAERDLINASITYAFVFAMINVSVLNMVLTRYLADQIYIKKKENILSSLNGALATMMISGSLACVFFFASSPLPLLVKVLTYVLFLELTGLYITMVFLSAVRDFKMISFSFILGTLLTLFLILIMNLYQIQTTIAILVSIDTGFLANLFFMLVILKKHFGKMGDHPFKFLKYVTKMPRLVLISVFYTLGLFAHNIIFWLFSNISIRLQDTYLFAPAYDTATFLAVLTIIPSTVIFVVKVETSFYEKYREFCQALVNGGSIKAIDFTKENMILTLKKELTDLFEIQFITSFCMIILGAFVVLPALGANSLTVGIYAVLVIGYFLIQMMYIVVTILLYFDNQEDATRITGLFFVLSVVLSLITLFIGENFYGLGLCVSALIAFIYGVACMIRMLNHVDYRLFSKPPYMQEDEVTLINKHVTNQQK